MDKKYNVRVIYMHEHWVIFGHAPQHFCNLPALRNRVGGRISQGIGIILILLTILSGTHRDGVSVLQYLRVYKVLHFIHALVQLG